jgi:2,3-bisphosphoglycerate-independent phosphoglycerate mutase
MTRVIMLFLDGVGIGRKNPRVNPMFVASMPNLRKLLGGELPTRGKRAWHGAQVTVMPVDATLGVAGLPQSGTGQTALFTGVNAARLVGKHFGPYPYSTLRPVIEAHSIFTRLVHAGRSACFANAYPQKFFDYIERRRTRMTVTNYSCLTAGIPLRRVDHLEEGTAVSADITGAAWPGLGHPGVRPITPAEAGARLARLSRAYDFVLFEYWRTDHEGHARSMEGAVSALEMIDEMLGGIIGSADLASTMLVITSDHGNMEDLSTKTHTLNPVPLVLAGHGHAAAAERIQHFGGPAPDLTHILPVLMEVMRADSGAPVTP